MQTDSNWPLAPIGFFYGDRQYVYEAPRQGIYSPAEDEGQGEIRLLPGRNFEQALRDLDGFERIWLIFGFDRNRSSSGPGWKPLVRPPRTATGKIGVFATRSPHRPNGLGLSAVRLLGIEHLTIAVSQADLLNEAPIFDIKPYVPAYDSFPEARTGWLEPERPERTYTLDWSEPARVALQFLNAAGGPRLERFVQLQLTTAPTDGARKRIRPTGADGGYVLAFRTWRVRYEVIEAEGRVRIDSITSGYSATELAAPDDPYGDLELHRRFTLRFVD